MLSKVMERMDVMGFTEERKKVGGLVLEGLLTSQGLAVMPDLFGGSVQCTTGQFIRPSGHLVRVIHAHRKRQKLAVFIIRKAPMAQGTHGSCC